MNRTMNARTIERAKDIAVLPRGTVQAEWTAMMEGIREVADVLEHAHLVEVQATAYLILPAFTNMDAVERILFCNLLFDPHTRIDNGRTIEVHGTWRSTWRRYAEWTMRPAPFQRLFMEGEEEVKVFAYQYDVVEVAV
jgi:hypothetical protein